jgi:phytoene/squalene synthetase
LDRVYVPRDSLNAVGIDVAALSEPASSSAMRSVLNNMLDGCDELLSRSAPLANLMGSLRLAAETAVIQEMAVTLAAKLRREDPLATRVELSKPRFLLAGLIGVSRLRWFGRRTSLPADVRREDRREQH